MMLWISHRGESADAPENTLEAFALGRKRNTDGCECDVHMTHDGKLVVCHDNTTERMGGRILNVELENLADVQSVNVSGKHKATYPDTRIPLFADSLKEIGPGRKFYIELKNGTPALADAVKAELDKGVLAPDQVVLISFSFGTCEYAKKIMPQYQNLWLTGSEIPTTEELIAKVKAAGIDGVDLHFKAQHTTREAVKKMHDAGLYVAVWTVDGVEDAREMIANGVDAITSNCAAKVRDAIQE